MAVSAAGQSAATAVQGELGSPGARLVAQIIDGVVAIIPGALGGIGGSMMAAAAAEEETSIVGIALIGLCVIAAVGVVVYQLMLLARQGQTIGKRQMGLRIVKVETGQNGGFVPNVVMRLLVNGLLGIIPFYQLVDVLFIFRADRRCLHDKLAGTIVVRG